MANYVPLYINGKRDKARRYVNPSTGKIISRRQYIKITEGVSPEEKTIQRVKTGKAKPGKTYQRFQHAHLLEEDGNYAFYALDDDGEVLCAKLVSARWLEALGLVKTSWVYSNCLDPSMAGVGCMRSVPLPSQPGRIPLKCALCLMAYFRLMKPGSICRMTGCSPLQIMQCVNNPNYGYIIGACLDGRIWFRIRDETLSSELGEL